jgi:hypothetical protein
MHVVMELVILLELDDVTALAWMATVLLILEY